MIQRALVHVAGFPGSGKTMFIERLLESNRMKILMAARAVRDRNLAEVQETASRSDAELNRYREAGASNVARFVFPGNARERDDFFGSDFMSAYSEGVFIEGESTPLFGTELRVFITPPVPEGKSLLCRVTEDRTASRAHELAQIQGQFDTPKTMEEFLSNMFTAEFGGRPAPDAGLADVSRSMSDLLARSKAQRKPPATKRWALANGFSGIEQAQVVVINVRSASERARGEAMLQDVVRLRRDHAVFDDVIGLLGKRTPITVGVADISDPKDKGLKRLITRVKRAFAERR